MSVTVTLKTLGPLRDSLGKSELRLTIEGANVGDLLDALAQEYGPKVKTDLLDKAGNLADSLLVHAAGVRVLSLKNPLNNGDEVILSTPITT